MKFHLLKSESAGNGIARINRELCKRARQTIESGGATTDSTVFELRKSVKKLRAILRIVRPALDEKSFRKLDRLIREFGRELGRVRDSAVLVDTFDSLLARFKPYPDEAALQPARNALRCRYQVALEDFLQRNDALSLASGFGAIEQQVRDLDLQACSRPMLLAGIRKTYRRCRTWLRRLHAEPVSKNSHDLRRQVKYAWNQLRLIRKLEPGAFRTVIDDLDRLGRLLGEDSDIAVLVETVQRHPEICCSRVRTEFIIALAEARRIRVLTASLHLADRIFAGSQDGIGK